MKKSRTILVALIISVNLQGVSQNIAKQYSGEKLNSLDSGIENIVTATIIYDNYTHNHDLNADWGYSILLDGLDKTILFDTGTKAEVFKSNFEMLELDARDIDEVFISHEHGDHFGGLHQFLKMNNEVSVVIPETFSSDFVEEYNDECKQIEIISIPVQICDNLYTTGVIGHQIPEQALVLNTKKGLIVMTGCSHPGIITMLNEVRATFNKNIYMVFGGFHLMNSPDRQIESIIEDMKLIGVEKCGATHCTGERQIELFKNAFGKNFVEMGAGNVITFE